MPRRNWKKQSPRSQRHAMELCIAYAKERKNLSVNNIADLMGVADHWRVYKWMESGRIPLVLLSPFEHACGINFVTQYITARDGYMLVKIPKGTKSSKSELLDLQTGFNEALNLLADFYKGESGDETDKVIGALTATLIDIATHRVNVIKVKQPELPL